MTQGKARLGLEELRRRAEQALGARSEASSTAGASQAELPELVFELQVHQCELELQNEELQRVQAELQEAHDRYFELFDLAPIAYLTVDRDCRVLEANLAATALIGCDRRELLTRALPAYVCGDDVHRFHRFWARAFETGTRQACAVTLERPGAGPVPVHLDALAHTSGDDLRRARVVLLDLSEITRTRVALSESQSRFRSVFETTGVGVVVTEPSGRVAEANAAACQFFGYRAAELEGRTLDDLTHPDDREACARELQRARSQPGVTVDLEARYVRGDGATVWGHLAASWVSDDAGAPLQGVGLVHDVTERKRSERALREKRAELQGVLDTASDAIVTVGEDGRIRTANPRAQQLFGYTAEELHGESVRILVPAPHHDEFDAQVARFLRSDDPPVLRAGRELVAVHQDGHEIPVRLALSEIRLEGERLFCAFLQDLTRAKRLEEQLHLAQRMEAVGTLASGVAHDFNNLLMGLCGCANLALDSLEPGHPARLYLEEIKESVGAGAQIARQLIDYSRHSHRKSIPTEVIELNDAVQRARGLIEPLLGEGIELTLELTPEDSHVLAGAGRLAQVLLNLANNARDAMPEGGELRIQTRPVDRREEEWGLPAGDYMALTVTDTGAGMPADVCQRIFDPFFTTKPESAGSGLGLFSCYGIVRGWGGHIAVRSKPGQGTRFEILLRRGQVTRVAEVQDDTPAEELPPTGETVLLVEDDRLVRLTTRYYLEEAGYAVIEAERGDEAVDIARTHAGPISAVLTDVTLPGIQGASVAREIRALRGGAKVVFMSAHPREVLLSEGRIEANALVLIKPFSREELLAQIGQVLGKTPAEGFRTSRP